MAITVVYHARLEITDEFGNTRQVKNNQQSGKTFTLTDLPELTYTLQNNAVTAWQSSGNWSKFDFLYVESDQEVEVELVGNSGGSSGAYALTYLTDTEFLQSASSELEFTGSLLRLADQTPTNALCGATYTSDANLNWGVGSLTGTLNNGAAVSSGRLDLTGTGADKHVEYDATNVVSAQQTGTFRCIFRPNYTGSPSSNVYMLNIQAAAGDTSNQIAVYQTTGGSLRALIRDSSNVTQVSADFGVWSPTAGTDYEIQFCWDGTTGANRMFIDGSQHGSTNADTFTRSSSVAQFLIGDDANPADGYVSEFMVFSDVQCTTSGYTPGAGVVETRYVTTNPNALDIDGQVMAGLTGFTETATKPTGTEIKYTLRNNGTEYYWNGSAWATSDGTYAQANTAAEINANAASLDLGTCMTVKPRAFLHSDDGSARPELTSLSLSYTDTSEQLMAITVSADTPMILGSDDTFHTPVGGDLLAGTATQVQKIRIKEANNVSTNVRVFLGVS